MENRVIAEATVIAEQPVAAAPVIDVNLLVQWRDAAEDSSSEARKLAERDRDYYDGKQLTSKEVKALEKRGQPVTIFNRIRRKQNFLGGLEKRQRANPKAMPRTPVEEENASAATDAIRYVLDEQDFGIKRSKVWENIRIEGTGGYYVGCEYQKDGKKKIVITRTPWDRMFIDPHSAEADCSDAKYVGVDVWMDEDEALENYKDVPEVVSIFEAAYTRSDGVSDTYEDKPKHSTWGDKKRRRIRVSQMYFKMSGVWYYAEFTYGGVLKGGISPYLNEDGEPECAFLYQSAYVDRDNNRYGEVREMISPQDAYNKRHSKLLYRTSVRQFRYDPTLGGMDDVGKVKEALADPGGVVEASKDGIELISNGDQSAAEFQLLGITGQELDTIGANSALLGEQGGAPSGKAIQLNQSGGMIELGDVFDGLRHLDRRVFVAVWNRVRQFWDEEMWVRVTDDERNVRFVGYNVDPMRQMEMMMQGGGQMPENVSVMQQPIAELDVDITIEDAPDGIEPQREQLQMLMELKQADPDSVDTEFIIEAMPLLRNKAKILERIEQKRQPDPQQQELQMRGAMSEIAKNETQAQLNVAKAQATESDAFTKFMQAVSPEPQQNQGASYG